MAFAPAAVTSSRVARRQTEADATVVDGRQDPPDSVQPAPAVSWPPAGGFATIDTMATRGGPGGETPSPRSPGVDAAAPRVQCGRSGRRQQPWACSGCANRLRLGERANRIGVVRQRALTRLMVAGCPKGDVQRRKNVSHEPCNTQMGQFRSPRQISPAIWQFFQDHPFGVKTPYGSPFPSVFPSYCPTGPRGADGVAP